jgi:hypothetical protein
MPIYGNSIKQATIAMIVAFLQQLPFLMLDRQHTL